MLNQFLLAEELPYFSVVSACVMDLENLYPIQICFGGITNSVPVGFDNVSSDIDLFLVYEGIGRLPTDMISLFNTAIPCGSIEAKLIPVEMINCPGENYCYPGVDPAWTRKRRLWNYEELPGNRNVEQSTLLTQIIYNRMLFDPDNYLETHFQRYASGLYIYDVLKRCYVWAKGRLKHYLKDEKVRVRTYLYAFYEVMLAEWIVKNKTYPQPMFLPLMDQSSKGVIKNELLNLYTNNKTASLDKENVLVPINNQLNDWLGTHLKGLSKQLLEFYENDKDATFDLKQS